MATTKSTTAKKAAPKKTTAKKTTAKKATVKKATVKKASAKRATPEQATVSTDAVRESIASATRGADDTIKQYTAVASDQLAELLELVRNIVDTSIGIPFVVQSRLSETATVPTVDLAAVKALVDDAKARLSATPSFDFDAVKSLLDDTKSFLDEAKGEGHARVVAVQGRLEPVADSVSKRFDEAAQKFEAQIPSQLSELLESGRARFRTLVAA